MGIWYLTHAVDCVQVCCYGIMIEEGRKEGGREGGREEGGRREGRRREGG